MGTIDLWMRDIVTYNGFIILILLMIGWIVRRQWHRFRQKLFRSHLLGFEAECADLALKWKKKLFKPLKEMKSNDEILRSMGRIRILEIGVKTGENLQFYPDGTHLIAVDVNKKLADYLIGGYRNWQFSHVYLERHVIGDGSSLRMIPSGCVDVVITTRSLCSTSSIRDTLCEIQRVLAPEGKYLFMEHVANTEETLVRWLQKLLTITNIWPSLFGNCHLDADPIEDIMRAQFKDTVYQYIRLDGYVSHPYHLFLTRRHLMGTAIR